MDKDSVVEIQEGVSNMNTKEVAYNGVSLAFQPKKPFEQMTVMDMVMPPEFFEEPIDGERHAYRSLHPSLKK